MVAEWEDAHIVEDQAACLGAQNQENITVLFHVN
jgi:hypothetical protein